MIENILDASAVLAVLQNETGREKVELIMESSVIGRINVTEVLTTLINKGSSLDDAIAAVDSLEIPAVEFDKIQSQKIAELRRLTKHLGLSLGDRACLALAVQEKAVAVTADRSWAELDICKIELIR